MKRTERSQRAFEIASKPAGAQGGYVTEELEIDGDAETSEGDGGVWVAAWVWVPDEEEG